MRLDRILQALLPHHERFHRLFEDAARNIVEASETLVRLVQAPREAWPPLVERIQDLEHKGDDVTHFIFSELSGTFVTPFDPEDIHSLASALDDILDNIHGSASRLVLYRIQKCPPDMITLIQSVHHSVLEMEKGVYHLRHLSKGVELQKIIRRIKHYEDEADEIFARAVADLFDMPIDPIEIIKLKEIYVSLETATDVCEDAADVLETIMIKHA
jgi:predicted phosphate transport protein (TIGR00153 family)